VRVEGVGARAATRPERKPKLFVSARLCSHRDNSDISPGPDASATSLGPIPCNNGTVLGGILHRAWPPADEAGRAFESGLILRSKSDENGGKWVSLGISAQGRSPFCASSPPSFGLS